MTTTTPPPVRCSTCRHRPERPGQKCEAGQRRPQKFGLPRRCPAHEQSPSLASPALALVPPVRQDYSAKTLGIFCDDVWIVSDSGAEPAHCCDQAEVIHLFCEWLAHRRASELARWQAERRRAGMTSVKS